MTVQERAWVDEEFEQRVREVAYELWERDGRPENAEKHFWFKALRRCLKEHDEDDRLSRNLVDPM